MKKFQLEKYTDEFLTKTDTINNDRIKSMFFTNKNEEIIKEALGYPTQIDMVVEILTDLIIDKIEDNINNQEYQIRDVEVIDYGDWEMKYDIIEVDGKEFSEYLKKSPKFNEEDFKKFPLQDNNIEIEYQVLPEIVFKNKNKKSPQIGGSHSFEPKKIDIKGYESTIEYYDIGSFEFNLSINDKQINNIKSIRSDISSVVAHEVFHAFQLYTKYKNVKTLGYGKEGVYNVMTNIIKSKVSKSWNNFIYCLYLSLRFEHQARIPQVYKELKDSGITNYQDFMSELKKTNVWDEITKLRSFSSEDFKKELSSVESLEDIFTTPFKEIEIKQNIENWNDFLKSIQTELQKRGLSVDKIKGLNPEVIKDPDSFFKYWERRFHQRAEELLRKVSKLYFLIKK